MHMRAPTPAIPAPTRVTPQTEAILTALQARGHATNQELLNAVRRRFPMMNITSVHRITRRLVDGGRIGMAPFVSGTIVFDARSTPHDHFLCTGCGKFRDLTLPASLLRSVERQLDRDIQRTGLVVQGACISCHLARKSDPAEEPGRPPDDRKY